MSVFQKTEFLFREIFHFHGIYLINRPFMKSLQAFLMIRDDMALSQCTWSNTINPCHCPGHSLF